MIEKNPEDNSDRDKMTINEEVTIPRNALKSVSIDDMEISLDVTGKIMFVNETLLIITRIIFNPNIWI